MEIQSIHSCVLSTFLKYNKYKCNRFYTELHWKPGYRESTFLLSFMSSVEHLGPTSGLFPCSGQEWRTFKMVREIIAVFSFFYCSGVIAALKKPLYVFIWISWLDSHIVQQQDQHGQDSKANTTDRRKKGILVCQWTAARRPLVNKKSSVFGAG